MVCLSFSVNKKQFLSLPQGWAMSNQVENPILIPCPPKNSIPSYIDLTSATQSNKKHKLTSVVSDFEKKTINGIPWAICNHCNNKLKAIRQYDTTHLYNHLQGCAKRNNGNIRDLFDQKKISMDKINMWVWILKI